MSKEGDLLKVKKPYKVLLFKISLLIIGISIKYVVNPILLKEDIFKYYALTSFLNSVLPVILLLILGLVIGDVVPMALIPGKRRHFFVLVGILLILPSFFLIEEIIIAYLPDIGLQIPKGFSLPVLNFYIVSFSSTAKASLVFMHYLLFSIFPVISGILIAISVYKKDNYL